VLPKPTEKYPEDGPLISISKESVVVFMVTLSVILEPNEVVPD